MQTNSWNTAVLQCDCFILSLYKCCFCCTVTEFHISYIGKFEFFCQISAENYNVSHLLGENWDSWQNLANPYISCIFYSFCWYFHVMSYIVKYCTYIFSFCSHIFVTICQSVHSDHAKLAICRWKLWKLLMRYNGLVSVSHHTVYTASQWTVNHIFSTLQFTCK